MARRLGFFALIAIATSCSPVRGQFPGGFGGGGFGGGGFGGYGYPGVGGPYVGFGYGYGYPGFGLPYASFPFPVATGSGNFYTGPGSYNPLFGMGTTPLAVDSFLGEMALRRPRVVAPPAVISGQPSAIVTVPGSGSRTYTYRIYRQ